MTYLLDTNTCIAYLGGKSARLTAKLNELLPQDVSICAVVKAELLFGAAKSQRADENMSRVTRFMEPLRSYPFDDSAAQLYAKVRYHLERAGTPIGPNDLIIAAIALSQKCTVVTANVREFSRVPDLTVENWI